MIKRKYTKTSTFLFPLLEIPKSIFQCEIKNGFGKVILTNRFVNAFVYNSSIRKHVNHLFVVINNYQDPGFRKFYDQLTDSDYYSDEYEIHDHLVIIYSVPDKFKEDYDKILDGKYSTISEEAKKAIRKNFFYDKDPSFIPMILEKSKLLKESMERVLGADIGDGEVWARFDDEQETLNHSKLKSCETVNKLNNSNEFN